MPWLRVDDGFTQHPKVVKLSRADRWTWLEVLCYCARYKTRGIVPAAVGEVVRGATPAYLERCFELHLLDLAGEDYIVHDWDDYNGSDPKVLQNERQRKHRDKSVTDAVTTPLQERDENVTRAQARARVPVPIPSKSFTGGSSTSDVDPPLAKDLNDALAVAKLLEVVGDVDEDGLAKIRGFAARLPEGSLYKVAESVRIQRPTNRVGYAIAALSSELRESVA